MVELIEIFVKRPLSRRLFESDRTKPLPVLLRPVVSVAPDISVTKTEFQEPVAKARELAAKIVAASQEITHRFLGLLRHSNRREVSAAMEPRQHPRVAAIRLDSVAWTLWNEPRRDDVTTNVHRRELSIHDESARSGFVTRSHLASRRNSMEETTDIRFTVGESILLFDVDSIRAFDPACADAFFVNVEPDGDDG